MTSPMYPHCTPEAQRSLRLSWTVDLKVSEVRSSDSARYTLVS